MSQDLINRYQPGGDVYAGLLAQYGRAAADAAAQAALTGDETQVNAALTTAVYGQPLNTSTASIFVQQLATNPLGAPLSSLDNVLSNTINSLFANKTVLIVGAAVVFLVFFDGLEHLQRWTKSTQ